MTEEAKIDGESEIVNDLPAIQEPESVPAEKTLTQTQVNKVVKREKRSSYDQGYKAAMEELKSQESQQPAEVQQQSSPEVNTPTVASTNNATAMMGGMSQQAIPSAEEIRKIAREAYEHDRVMAEGSRIANEFTNKLLSGREKYDDFDHVVSQLDIPKLPPQLIYSINQHDNVADIMYDISKNPTKLANLLILTHTAPGLADGEIRKLASSIRTNQEAQQNASKTSANAPLSQIRPSPTAVDNGQMTIRDLRRSKNLKA